MGVIYSVLCKQCRVYQDLDKCAHLEAIPVRDRSEAQKLAEAVKLSPFRPALLFAFMFEHAGHDCTVVNDASGDNETDGYELHASKVWDT